MCVFGVARRYINKEFRSDRSYWSWILFVFAQRGLIMQDAFIYLSFVISIVECFVFQFLYFIFVWNFPGNFRIWKGIYNPTRILIKMFEIICTICKNILQSLHGFLCDIPVEWTFLQLLVHYIKIISIVYNRIGNIILSACNRNLM